MDLETDFKELLELFNANGVEYLIVGAYALAHHGTPRYTADLDILVGPSAENADRIMEYLRKFGFGQMGLNPTDFQKPDQVVQLGMPPVRIDLITSISGVSWSVANAGRVEGFYGAVPVRVLGREQLVANKRASGRKKDLADLEALGED